MEKGYDVIKDKSNSATSFKIQIQKWIKLRKKTILLNKILKLNRSRYTIGDKKRILTTLGILKSVSRKFIPYSYKKRSRYCM